MRIRLIPQLTLALGLLVAVLPAPAEGSDGADRAAAPEALLARGIAHAQGSELITGLEELRLAAAARPGWRHARVAYGAALLRAGRFEEAAREFTSALGPEVARPLSDGTIGADELGFDIDTESVLGLATARHFLGDAREAERLYRTFADLVGPTSPEAGRAYQRLSELFSETDDAWADASAELAKARAVAPELAAAAVLPAFPDADSLPELAPYVAPLVLLPDRSDSSAVPESTPALDVWVAPGDSSAAAAALARGDVSLEILVDARGEVESVEVLGTWAAAEDIEGVLEAVRNWRFAPASSRAGPVPAWVIYGPAGDAASTEDTEPEDRPAPEATPEAPPRGEKLLPGEGK